MLTNNVVGSVYRRIKYQQTPEACVGIVNTGQTYPSAVHWKHWHQNVRLMPRSTYPSRVPLTDAQGMRLCTLIPRGAAAPQVPRIPGRRSRTTEGQIQKAQYRLHKTPPKMPLRILPNLCFPYSGRRAVPPSPLSHPVIHREGGSAQTLF